MYAGSGVFLLIVGAILAYAVSDEIDGVNLELVGTIVMAGGAALVLFSTFQTLAAARRRRSHTTTERVVSGDGHQVVESTETR